MNGGRDEKVNINFYFCYFFFNLLTRFFKLSGNWLLWYPGYAYDVALANNYAYVADFHYGLRIIEFYGVGIAESNFSKEKILTSHILNIEKETNLLDITGRKITKSKNLKKGIYFIKEKSLIKKIIIK